MEKNLALEIVDRIIAIEIPDEFYSNEIDETHESIKEYEKYFKALAIVVDGRGSLLWNFHWDDDGEDGPCPNIKEWKRLEAKWLREIGFKWEAKEWETT